MIAWHPPQRRAASCQRRRTGRDIDPRYPGHATLTLQARSPRRKVEPKKQVLQNAYLQVDGIMDDFAGVAHDCALKTERLNMCRWC